MAAPRLRTSAGCAGVLAGAQQRRTVPGRRSRARPRSAASASSRTSIGREPSCATRRSASRSVGAAVLRGRRRGAQHRDRLRPPRQRRDRRAPARAPESRAQAALSRGCPAPWRAAPTSARRRWRLPLDGLPPAAIASPGRSPNRASLASARRARQRRLRGQRAAAEERRERTAPLRVPSGNPPRGLASGASAASSSGRMSSAVKPAALHLIDRDQRGAARRGGRCLQPGGDVADGCAISISA